MPVRIDRVVTRGGDTGETSLGDGTRLPKSALPIEALGALDEANAHIGVLRSVVQAGPLSDSLKQLQNLLFDMGGDLCMPHGTPGAKRIDPASVEALEAEIETLRVRQAPLTSFVLPGGTPGSAWAHLVRTAVRRAERALVALTGVTTVTPALLVLANRLSDYFFVLARHLNADGAEDVLWQPGGAGASDDAG